MVKKAKKARKAKHSICGIIGLSFQKLFKNALIILPYVFSSIATAILLIPIFIVAGFSIFSMAFITEADISAIPAFLTVPFILFAVIIFLIIVLISGYFSSGATGMAIDVVRGRKTSLAVMHKVGKRFFFRYFLIGLMVMAFALVWFLLFSLPVIFTSQSVLLAIPVLSMIPFLFVFIFFSFAATLVVIYDLGPWQAIKKSAAFVKRNYWPVFGLILLYSLMSAVAGSIPFVGNLASTLIVVPALTIAFVIFILNRDKYLYNKPIKFIYP